MGKAGKRTRSEAEPEALLTPAEVAALFHVDPKTIASWTKAGKLSSLRTLDGGRRYRETEVRQLLRAVNGDERPRSGTEAAERDDGADIVPLGVDKKLEAEKDQVLQQLLAPEPVRDLRSAGAMHSGESDLSEQIEDVLYQESSTSPHPRG
jgi:DNA-binding transcriptional MerR regulator